MNELITELETKVKDCNNTNTIFNTRKYVSLDDAKELLRKALNIHIVSNSAPDNVRPSDVADNEWWCPKCKMIVNGKDVTFDERHDLNGCYEKVI